MFDTAQAAHFGDIPHDYTQPSEKDHGRIEMRRCWTISAPAELACRPNDAEWTRLCSLIKIEATRRIGRLTSTETRYHISSLTPTAMQALRALRSHWSIENELHWVLNAAFREDDCRVRTGNAAQNFATLQYLAVNLLKHEKTTKAGIKTKRHNAGWSTDYLHKVLSH